MKPSAWKAKQNKLKWISRLESLIITSKSSIVKSRFTDTLSYLSEKETHARYNFGDEIYENICTNLKCYNSYEWSGIFLEKAQILQNEYLKKVKTEIYRAYKRAEEEYHSTVKISDSLNYKALLSPKAEVTEATAQKILEEIDKRIVTLNKSVKKIKEWLENHKPTSIEREHNKKRLQRLKSHIEYYKHFIVYISWPSIHIRNINDLLNKEGINLKFLQDGPMLDNLTEWLSCLQKFPAKKIAGLLNDNVKNQLNKNLSLSLNGINLIQEDRERLILDQGYIKQEYLKQVAILENIEQARKAYGLLKRIEQIYKIEKFISPKFIFSNNKESSIAPSAKTPIKQNYYEKFIEAGLAEIGEFKRNYLPLDDKPPKILEPLYKQIPSALNKTRKKLNALKSIWNKIIATSYKNLQNLRAAQDQPDKKEIFFTNAKFECIFFEEINLTGTLKNCSFQGSTLNNCLFDENTKFHKVDFSYADIQKCDFAETLKLDQIKINDQTRINWQKHGKRLLKDNFLNQYKTDEFLSNLCLQGFKGNFDFTPELILSILKEINQTKWDLGTKRARCEKAINLMTPQITNIKNILPLSDIIDKKNNKASNPYACIREHFQPFIPRYGSTKSYQDIIKIIKNRLQSIVIDKANSNEKQALSEEEFKTYIKIMDEPLSKLPRTNFFKSAIITHENMDIQFKQA